MSTTFNKNSVTVLEALFKTMRDASYNQIADAATYLFNFVEKENTYSRQIVDAFRSVMEIMSEMSLDQFWQVKSLYV